MFGSKRPTSDEELTLSRRQTSRSSMEALRSHTFPTSYNKSGQQQQQQHRNPFMTNGSHNATANMPSLSLHRIRRLLSHRPAFLWWGIACCFLLFLLLRLPSSPPPSQKRRYEILFTHDLVEYQDTSQMTDYALLDKLLKSDQGRYSFGI
ncbi:hypothetical protein BDB00DRAFT_115040 [Zychaea mexicana]|uniref:uncharacterized protein n=1 Tax=Zychaea mexicana TaxID=64656 RepID=UPI0022FF0462|nr:uncharacterized protein BDB00DRAFT_115040 [Zychaea mexicana]KAI9484724.1 hypothetical protein BDB00DRAFT_115040 [Zychaea mexicana]